MHKNVVFNASKRLYLGIWNHLALPLLGQCCTRFLITAALLKP